MFQKTDFWIGLAVGAVAGIFGYRFMQEREQQMAAMQPAAPAGEIPLAELQRQKEELEDLVSLAGRQQLVPRLPGKGLEILGRAGICGEHAQHLPRHHL